MSPVLTKVIIAICVIVTFGALAFVIYTQQELKQQQSAIQTQIVQQQQLVDGIVRSQSTYATKDDITAFASANDLNLKAIQTNLSTLGSQLSAINVATADSTGQHGANLPSSGTGTANPKPPVATTTVVCTSGGTATCPNTDPFGFQKAEQDFTLNESFTNLQVPIGSVGFSAWQQSPWNVNILPREYNVDTVVGVDQNEKQTFYNKFTVNVNNKEYDIPIKTAKTEMEYPTPSWSWWNPRLLMGLDGGVNFSKIKGEFTPHIDIGIMSYGQYKTTPDFSILEVGFGYGTINKTGEVTITPVAYNIGKKLFSPLMNNTYIGPSFQIGTDGSLGAGIGVRVGF